MIKTKRVVAAVLAVLTLFNLTSCGGKAENTNKDYRTGRLHRQNLKEMIIPAARRLL